MVLVLGGPSRCLTPLLLLELSWRTSHRTPASSCDAPLLPSKFSIVSCRAMMTSSGRFSAEFPFSQTSSCVFDSKMLLKVSSDAGGGIGLDKESGWCRLKNAESQKSGKNVSMGCDAEHSIQRTLLSDVFGVRHSRQTSKLVCLFLALHALLDLGPLYAACPPGCLLGVGRLGGDEFAVVCAGTGDPMVGRTVADRIVDAVRRPIALRGLELRVSASVGVAVGAQPLIPAQLMKRADDALYLAKASGKNTVRLAG